MVKKLKVTLLFKRPRSVHKCKHTAVRAKNMTSIEDCLKCVLKTDFSNNT
jgi:hypothetical protein